MLLLARRLSLVIHTVAIIAATVLISLLSSSFQTTIAEDGSDVDTISASTSSTDSSERVRTINIGNGPCGIAVDSGSQVVYVSNYNENTVSIIDSLTHEVLNRIEVADGPCGVVVDQESNIAYVISEKGYKVSSIDGSTGALMTEFEVDGPYEMVFNEGNGLLYVTSDTSGRVFAIDPASGGIIATFDIPSPCGIAINQEEETVYVTSETTGQVFVIDTRRSEIVSRISVEEGPRGVAYNPLTRTLLVANTVSNSVSVIDGEHNRVISTLSVDSGPRRITVDPDSNMAYVISRQMNSVGFIDLITNEVVDSIGVPSPYDVAVDKDSNLVYVSNPFSEQLYLVEGYDLAPSEVDGLPGNDGKSFSIKAVYQDGGEYYVSGIADGGGIKAASVLIEPGRWISVGFEIDETIAGDNRTLSLTLPKDMIDGIHSVQVSPDSASIHAGEDISFRVEEETFGSDSYTTVRFALPEGADMVNILGARVVPEIHVILSTVLAASLVSIVVYGRLFRSKWTGFRGKS